MPIYSFLNTETNEEFEEIMSYDDKLKFLEENPHIQSIITKALAIGDDYRLGRHKPDDAFRDHLKHIQSKHAGSTINTF
jgi:hypothetical protein